MKLAPTKVLAKEINKRISGMEVVLVELTPRQAAPHLGFFAWDYDCDYDPAKGKYKMFAIVYPDYDYAGTTYIGTGELNSIAHNAEVCGGLTIDNFCREFQEVYEI